MNSPLPQNALWEVFLVIVKNSIPHESYNTWFRPMRMISVIDNRITVQVPSQFYFDWIEEHYSSIIASAIAESYGPEFSLIYSILEGDSLELLKHKPIRSLRANDKKTSDESHLNHRYTFDNFIEGECNSFARAAALAVSEAPGKTLFNPLVIYGGVGLGKTHLVQAIGNFALKHNKVRRAVYVSSEQFTVDFINSVKDNKSTNFSRQYRSADILMIDDAQFFAGKERTQMEFFHTFNTLYQSGKQIVLSLDRPPSALDNMEARLISRFHVGLTVDIKPPDYETRAAILRKRVEEDCIFIPDDVLDFLALNISSNVRELEGSLIRLMAHASITGQDIDLPLAKRLLKDIIKVKQKTITVETIQNTVGKWYGIPSDLIRGNSRKKEISHSRQMAMFICNEMTNHTLKSIVSLFGNRDHATVIHSIRVIKKEFSKNKNLREEYERLKHEIEVQSF